MGSRLPDEWRGESGEPPGRDLEWVGMFKVKEGEYYLYSRDNHEAWIQVDEQWLFDPEPDAEERPGE